MELVFKLVLLIALAAGVFVLPSYITTREARRNRWFCFPATGFGTIILHKGSVWKVIYAMLGPRHKEFVNLVNRRNAEYLLDSGEVKTTETFTVDGKVLKRQKRKDPPLRPTGGTEDDKNPAYMEFLRELDVFDEEVVDQEIVQRKYDEALLAQYAAKVRDRCPYYAVSENDRFLKRGIYMGFPWVGRVLQPKRGALLSSDGFPVTVSLREHTTYVPPESKAKEEAARLGKQATFYVANVFSQDGVATEASLVFQWRIHDEAKYVLYLENDLDEEKLLQNILNVIAKAYRNAVADLRWDVVIQMMGPELEARMRKMERAREGQRGKLETELGRTMRALREQLIYRQLDERIGLELGLLRHALDEKKEHIVGTKPWNIQYFEGDRIERYPESNDREFARIYFQWGVNMLSLKVQDVKADTATEKVIQGIVTAMFQKRKSIVDAEAQRQVDELAGIGAGAKERETMKGRGEGIKQFMIDTGTKDQGLEVLRLQTTERTFGATEKTTIVAPDLAGLVGGIAAGSKVVENLTTKKDRAKDSKPTGKPTPDQPTDKGGETA